MEKIIEKIHHGVLAIFLVLLGTIELAADLIPLLLQQTGAPEWVGTTIRIFAFAGTAYKLYKMKSRTAIDHSEQKF